MARRKLWVPFNSGLSVGAAASTTLDLLAANPVDLESVGGITVERIVGEVKYRVDVPAAYQQFNMGIGVFAEELSATADLSISGDARPWLWTLMTRTSGLFSEAASGDFDGVEEVRFIDVKSRRKVPASSQLQLRVGNGAGETLFFNLGIRILILLP